MDHDLCLQWCNVSETRETDPRIPIIQVFFSTGEKENRFLWR